MSAVALQTRSGTTAERLTIGNDGIRGEDGGRVFDAEKLALSYGTTVRIESAVDFPAGHTEPASGRSVIAGKGSAGLGVPGSAAAGSRQTFAVPSLSTAPRVDLGLALLAWVRTRR